MSELAAPVTKDVASGDDRPPAASPRLVRRLFPVLAAACLIAISMIASTWWDPWLFGKTAWVVPNDLWSTLVAASRVWHLDLAGLYTRPTDLVTLPGGAVILVPVVAVIDAAGISLRAQGPSYPYPGAWPLAALYEIAISSVALFAADALAERLGATRPKRALLAAAGAVALWSVSARWGHPEDAVAVGLLLYGVLALAQSRVTRAAWLIGAAVAVQPVVLLALPVLLVVIEPKRLAGFLAKAAAPSVVLLGAAATADWTATFTAVTRQPNWPAVDHPTPWLFLAPHLAGGAVSTGPARALSIVVACGCALALRNRFHAARQQPQWSAEILANVVWWAGVTLALRSVFEPVMVSYYLWPPLAAALIVASRSWLHLIATSTVVVAITFGSQANLRGEWAWWAPMLAGLALTLFLARVPLRRSARILAAPST